MAIPDEFLHLGAALGIGLLVGLQRERARSAIAGIRTFALIALLGGTAALLADRFGGWVVVAGFIGVAVLALVGNINRKPGDESPGVTTEAAMLLVYAVGALAIDGPLAAAVGVGAMAAILLYVKPQLHGLVGRLSDADVKAIMQFAAISLVILPVLPDDPFGPFDVLSLRHIWWMVVLVVGISLLGYVAYRVLGERAGTMLAGLLGGMISSTATTVSFSKRARGAPDAAGAAALAIMLASTVVYGRVLVEVYAVAPRHLAAIAGPVGAMLGLSAALAGVAWFGARRSDDALPEQSNPAELKGALIFAGLYAVVLVAAAAGNHYFGGAGIYVVAGISGLTDMDAITLSAGRMAAAETLTAGQTATSIVIAAASNLLFKTGIVAALGGRALLGRLAWMMGAMVAAGVAVVAGWTTRM